MYLYAILDTPGIYRRKVKKKPQKQEVSSTETENNI